MVVKQHGKLRVYNRIYEWVFDDSWVKNVLADLRPYSEAIAAWLDSNCQDESRLLQGQALEDAQIWADGKSLSDQDYRFLSACQELDKQEVQIALKVKEEESRILAEANQALAEAQQKANRKIKIGSKIMLYSLLVATFAGALAFGAIQTLRDTKEATRIEKEGARASQSFSWDGETNTEALLLAMRAGQDLRTLVKDGRSVQDYPTTSPILALQEILPEINQSNHSYSVNDVSFSSDGQRFASAQSDGTVRIWDLSGKQLAVLKGHQDRVVSVSFSPDGQRLATVGNDNTAQIWDLSGQQLTQLRWEADRVNINTVRFSPDGQRLVGIVDDDIVRLWDLNGKQLAKWKPGGVGIPTFSPDGQRLATLGEEDNTIRLWDLSGKLLSQWTIKSDEVGRLMFSPDGQHLATDGWSGAVGIWDLSGKQLVQWKVEPYTTESVSFSPDGRHLVGIADKGTVRLWNLRGKLLTEIKRQPGEFKVVSFSRDGQYLATGGYNGAVSIWDLSGKQMAEIIKGHQQGFDGMTLSLGVTYSDSVIFSQDGQHIATLNEDGRVRLWNRSGQKIAEFASNQAKINQVTFSRNGQHLATVATVRESMDLTVERIGSTFAQSKTPDSVVQIWNLSGQSLVQLKGHQGNVLKVKFSPNGQQIATTGEDGTARLWDLSGWQLAELKDQGKIYDVTFSPDNHQLVTVGEKGMIQLRDLQWKVSDPKVNYVSFSPDGQRIATAQENGSVRIWNLSGKQLAEFRGNERTITAVLFSSDGQRIATVNSSNKTLIWELSGRQIGLFEDFKGFSPDGQYVATQSYYGIVQLQRVRGLDELLAEGCNWLKDYFVSHPEALKYLKVCQKK